ncbi:hypothetical protein AU193_22455 [Mycobacterium sp. GA-1285]|uniref:hypothetical protein n=1 Tax=Mycobacterium sp. GA-1285 TaxID=1772282 RepID=UPI00074AA7F1|nr:hypothetical protein [Mycobacterium sp. GA-1285]KUI16946.1 hypothetical protein AU193_22455 [Mycobacterium sp. GA-1285]
MSAFTRARARVALLSQSLPPDDPVVVEARRLMREAFVVEKISAVLGDGPTLTPELRSQIDEVLSSREKQVLA